jgi:hypothetical protein
MEKSKSTREETDIHSHLYNQAGKIVERKDKTLEEIEYQRSKEECTFQPNLKSGTYQRKRSMKTLALPKQTPGVLSKKAASTAVGGTRSKFGQNNKPILR